MADDSTMNLCVRSSRFETPEILRIELTDPAGNPLPEWQPGAHVDVHLPSGLIRQYSLCADPADRSSYEIAVQRENPGRGGSRELCGLATAGTLLEVGRPRNHFPLLTSADYLLLAGGIGITPLLTMAREAGRCGSRWHLIYGGRTRSRLAFLEEVNAIPGGTVSVMTEDEQGLPDLSSIIGTASTDTLIYCCGPGGMLDAAQAAASAWGRASQFHCERFSAPAAHRVDADANQPFEVLLARSGRVLQVPADKRLGEVLLEAGVSVSFSCEEGYCGTCETRVLEGQPDHRDSVLTGEGRDCGKYMMVCISRAKTPRLVLEL